MQQGHSPHFWGQRGVLDERENSIGLLLNLFGDKKASQLAE
jgi:hypothetical protein